jgi:hypothetical protein
MPRTFGFQRRGSLRDCLRSRDKIPNVCRRINVQPILECGGLPPLSQQLKTRRSRSRRGLPRPPSGAARLGCFYPHSASNARRDSRSDYAATNNIPSSPHHSASRNPRGRDASRVPNCCNKPPRHDSTYGSRGDQHRNSAPRPRTPRRAPAPPKLSPIPPPQDSWIDFASAIPPATNNPKIPAHW